jgi:STE24 endopeptidase
VSLLLLRSSVPDDLPNATPPASFWNQALLQRADRYERFLDVLWVLSTLTLVAVLAVYARRGVAYVRESSAGPIGTGMLLGMLGLGIVWLVRLPFRLVAHWWDRRYGVDELGYLTWLFADWAVLAAEFLSVCIALLIVMALARRLGERWWLPGAAVFVGIAALFSFATPYLVYGTHPLREQPLRAAALRYERRLDLPRIPVRVLDVGDTREVNAFAAGLGPSRRVVVWDTLVDGNFPLGEQEVVVAHELGHHASKHILKGLAWFAAFAIPGAWILMRATRGRGGMGVPEAVPLALLVVALVQIVAAPAQNWISRRMEAEADWKALQLTRDPRDFERLMRAFQTTSLENPSPPAWAYALLATHPTLEQRVAMARAWAARERRG